MLKLKLQYFGHLIRRVDLLEKTLMLGGIGGRRRRGRQRMRWLDGITDSMDIRSPRERGLNGKTQVLGASAFKDHGLWKRETEKEQWGQETF